MPSTRRARVVPTHPSSIPIRRSRSGGRVAPLAIVLFSLLAAVRVSTAETVTSDPSLAAGDRAWAERAGVLDEEGLRAAPETIGRAIDAYRRAVEARPDALEPRWKLMRALHYSIDFAVLDAPEADRNAEAAIALARESVALLERVEGTSFDRARIYFWSSIAWGTRLARVGPLALVREGVATRMHDFAERALALDEGVDRGGSLRLLARLHTKFPRIPFVSGWVDRAKAMPFAERAMALDPDHPGNPLILALTILDLEPERDVEARAALLRAIETEPRADFLAEDLRIREQARARLAELDAASENAG
ncbi:MAG: hypothetical protein AAGC67_01905 [Myxococcota bacterium]